MLLLRRDEAEAEETVVVLQKAEAVAVGEEAGRGRRLPKGVAAEAARATRSLAINGLLVVSALLVITATTLTLLNRRVAELGPHLPGAVRALTSRKSRANS